MEKGHIRRRIKDWTSGQKTLWELLSSREVSSLIVYSSEGSAHGGVVPWLYKMHLTVLLYADCVQASVQDPLSPFREAAFLPSVLPLQLSWSSNTGWLCGKLHQPAEITRPECICPQFYVVAPRGPLQELPQCLFCQDRRVSEDMFHS
jgi:hypothetical protein